MSRLYQSTITCDKPGCVRTLVVALPLEEAWRLAKLGGWSQVMEWGQRIDRCPECRSQP